MADDVTQQLGLYCTGEKEGGGGGGGEEGREGGGRVGFFFLPQSQEQKDAAPYVWEL